MAGTGRAGGVLPFPDQEGENRFEKQVQVFLAGTRITGVQTEVDDTTRLLVAASALIPVFDFPDWEYRNLSEVFIVPKAWRLEKDPSKELKTLVGTLFGSVQDFRESFDRQNVGIHEFAHLLDEADGVIDGLPRAALPANLLQTWATLVQREIKAIAAGKSDINAYAATKEAEFFAVVTEYFFEKPEKLQKNHPKLLELLGRVFRQNPKKHFLRRATDPREWLKTLRSRRKFGRNDPCACQHNGEMQ